MWRKQREKPSRKERHQMKRGHKRAGPAAERPAHNIDEPSLVHPPSTRTPAAQPRRRHTHKHTHTREDHESEPGHHVPNFLKKIIIKKRKEKRKERREKVGGGKEKENKKRKIRGRRLF